MMLLAVFTAIIHIAAALQALPPTNWTHNGKSDGFELSSAPRKIYIDKTFSSVRDQNGLTLIPPSACEFAETFRADISSLFSDNNATWTLEEVDELPSVGIVLGPFRGNAGQVTYENGDATEEGYEIEVTDGRVYIGGTGARGMFWATRTLLQELAISNGSLPSGRTVDAPAYATRGYMLDAGRKYYSPDFLKELCTYASFFKISEFHYHSSDNYPLNRGHNATWQDVFAQFSLYPEINTSLQGIIQRPNETLSRADFEDFQSHCAQRGITVIPEIEAPGHALAITKWKPELALATKDLLNLTHPDAIPTVKAIWIEFLPWFQTKEVHIGADEYDAKLAADYINFVNEMSGFIRNSSGKRVRIWGTNEPSTTLSISKDVITQHWQYGESDPVALQAAGYDIINSEDWWAYMSLKNDHTPILPATYPQYYNISRTLNFADTSGWQWEPALFNPVNKSMQLEAGAKGNKGAILAAWNDNGPDATTQLEAYYAVRDGLPVMAARAWAGARGVRVEVDGVAESIAFLVCLTFCICSSRYTSALEIADHSHDIQAPKAPGQNLDRRIPNSQNPSTSNPLISWSRSSTTTSNKNKTGIGQGSYGPPYRLTLNVSSPFTLSGPDTSLSLTPFPPSNSTNPNTDNNHCTSYTLTFTTSDNAPYPLRSTSLLDGHSPLNSGRIWTNQTMSSHDVVAITLPAILRIETDTRNGSRVWVGDEFVGRFEVYVYGGRNTLFSWSQMAFVAPLGEVDGGVDGLVLEGGVEEGVGMDGR